MLSSLSGILRPPLLVAGIGNILKGDDGAGPLLIEKLRQPGLPFPIVDCGEAPENYMKLFTAHQTGCIVFVDAVAMGSRPGSIEVFRPEQLSDTGFFTHGTSLGMLIEVIATGSAAQVFLIGIQPASLRLGEPVSPEVAAAVERLAEALHHLYEAHNHA